MSNPLIDLIMITLENISEHGLDYISMAISDLVSSEGKEQPKLGMYIGKTYLTPETCYWLYQFLITRRSSCIVSDDALGKLRNSTNHPEMLK